MRPRHPRTPRTASGKTPGQAGSSNWLGQEELVSSRAFLAPAVAQPQPDHALLVACLAQVVVTLVGVDDRVLVGEVGDVEFGQPMGVDLIETDTHIAD